MILMKPVKFELNQCDFHAMELFSWKQIFFRICGFQWNLHDFNVSDMILIESENMLWNYYDLYVI